eukprot:CAMPEP_0179268566 /NCGR_PEP_ID=MMETSP0797-20121207/30507_1 /TAXON_ID=47934 /ORGANISM="Dinophysis acuminata, Strain DAEP01" /LENGTH=570 /DNA_ID=CAMNT_0020976853 /DNA_START=26 /DNA_END=1738 /DNA_ORIENTATION=+
MSVSHATILTLALLGGAAPAYADCPPAPRPYHINQTFMTSVTVFVDRAEVVRKLPVQLYTFGPFSVLLRGLPESLELGSVWVESRGQDLRILDVSDTVSMGYSKSPQGLEEDLSAIEAKLTHIESNLTRLHFLMSALDNFTKVRLGMDLTLNAAAATFEFYTMQFGILSKQLSEVDGHKRELSRKRSEAEGALAAYRDSHVRAAIVDAQLGADPACTVTAQARDIDLYFHYIVRNASWSPSYDIQVRGGEDAVDFVYYGNVLQSTGEDWNSVRLSLSTADPSRPVSPPRVRKRSIHFKEDIGKQCDSPECMYDNRILGGGDARQAQGGAAGGVLDVPRIVTLPTDMGASRSRRLAVSRCVMAARFAHYATPAVNPHAYLHATMNNTCLYPLVPSSQVRVFFEGGAVATSRLGEIVGINATFAAFLGVDPAVRIHVGPEVQRYESFQRGDVTTFTSRVQLANRRAAPLHMLLQDSVVQSTSNKIKVDMVSPSELVPSLWDVDPFGLPPGGSLAFLDTETGALTRAVCLGPHSEMELPMVFTATTSSRGRYVAVSEGRTLAHDLRSDASTEL